MLPTTAHTLSILEYWCFSGPSYYQHMNYNTQQVTINNEDQVTEYSFIQSQ